MKNFTEIVTSALVKNNLNNTESKLYVTKLMSILISSSSESNKEKDINNAIKNNLTIIDFQECEDFLKTHGYLPKNEVISYSKNDWSAMLKSNQNENTTESGSMSFDLYSSNGTLINKNLCNNTKTKVLIPIIGFNDEMLKNLTKDGFDLSDQKSEYFSSLCIPMKKGDKANVLEDRLSEFNSLNLTCSKGCDYQSLNLTIGYLVCECNTNENNEINSEYGTILLSVFQLVNINIVTCWRTTFKFVCYIYT